MNMHIWKHLAGVLAVGALAGCGGGGSSSETPNASIEGIWSGTSSSGYTLNVLSLENGSTYSLFGTVASSVFTVVGFDQGTITVSGNSLSGSVQEYVPNVATATGGISGTVSGGNSISGSTVYGATTTTFNLTPIANSAYAYSNAPQLTNIAGSWSGTMLNGDSATVNIATPSGAISGSTNGCSFTGTATPRASGKNVFNVNLTFGAAPCALAGQAVTGVAVDYLITGTALRQLIVVVQDTSRANGTVFLASR